MSAIKGFVYKHKNILIFIVLILICFILMFSSNKKVTINLKKTGFSILYPFQVVFHSIGNFFQNTINSISQLKKSQEEIESLRNEIDDMEKIMLDFKELNRQNFELNKLLELKNKTIYKSIACEVIGRDPKKMFDVIILNKGSNDGIKVNMPVITYGGGRRILVGKVSETTPFASKVITLQNPKFSASSVIQSNNVYTIIEGESRKPGIIKLLYVPKNFKLIDNNIGLIITSGDSFIFPRGLEIGRIFKIYESERYENFNVADIKITAELANIDYVLVLKIDYNTDDFKLLEEIKRD